MKDIFTRKQAVSIINQVKNGSTNVSFKTEVESNNPLFKLSNEQLFQKLCEFMEESSIAGVVEEI